MEDMIFYFGMTLVLTFLLWLCIRLYAALITLIWPRYIKPMSFLKMMNDGKLLKLTAQTGFTVSHHYINSLEFVVEDGDL